MLVDNNLAAGVQLDAGRRQIQGGSVRAPAGRDQDGIRRIALSAVFRLGKDFAAAHFPDLHAADDLNAARSHLRQHGFRNLRILAGDEGLQILQDGDMNLCV